MMISSDGSPFWLIQYVSMSSVTNFGAPQGSAISPVWFTLYTNECSSNTLDHAFKFANDMAVVGLIQENDEDS